MGGAMSRSVPPDRLDELVRRAIEVFIRQGYRRTQMADVAQALGVAKGTLYLYVEGKEALFDLALRRAGGDARALRHRALPLRAPAAGATLRYVRQRLARGLPPPALAAALAARQVRDVRAELEGIAGQVYDTLERHRLAIQLVDRCAHDRPHLAALWYREGRGALLESLTAYLERRRRQGLLPRVTETRLAARMLLETAATWAVHRHWDPAPQVFDAAAVRAAVVRFIVHGLAGGDG
jgi:AcrR family transcriptional regulator